MYEKFPEIKEFTNSNIMETYQRENVKIDQVWLSLILKLALSWFMVCLTKKQIIMQLLFYLIVGSNFYQKNKKQKKKVDKSKDDVKEELIKSRVENGGYDNNELNEKAEKVIRCEDVITIVKQYERLTKN